MLRRIDVKPDNIEQFGSKSRIVGQLELANLGRLQTMLAPDTLHRTDADADVAGHCDRGPVGDFTGCFGLRGGDDAGLNFSAEWWDARRAGLSRSSPGTPSARNRSCHRQTEVLLVPVRRGSSIVPQPSAVSSTICARQTRFCGLFRSVTIVTRCWRSVSERLMLIRWRIRQTRTRSYPGESLIGCKRQIISTSDLWSRRIASRQAVSKAILPNPTVATRRRVSAVGSSATRGLCRESRLPIEDVGSALHSGDEFSDCVHLSQPPGIRRAVCEIGKPRCIIVGNCTLMP